MTELEMIKEFAPACIDDMNGGGVLASVSLALIMIGRLEKPDSYHLIHAHDGKKNRGKPLYPGIDTCKSFAQAAEILGDADALNAVNRRWNLERFDRPQTDKASTTYKASSSRIPLYAGPGKQYAKLNHCSKRGNVEITTERDGFGRVKDTGGWVELAKLKGV